jgi:hypothetical protein
MSELQIKPEMPEEKLKEVPIERKPEKGRLAWVDAARGFIILWLIASIAFPGDSNLTLPPIIYGLFKHGPALIGNITFTMYDIGAPAFIFLLGLTMPVSYRKRKEEQGAASAVRYILFRYLLLFVLGFVAANINLEFLQYYSFPLGRKADWVLFDGFANIPMLDRPIMFIIPWDVVISIATAGLIGFMFMAVRNPKYRFFLGYAWIIFYQVALSTSNLAIYAEQSIHGGIFGSIFGYGAVAIIATSMGDYLFFSDVIETKKYRALLIFGAANFLVTIIWIWRPDFIANWSYLEVSRHLVNFTYVVTAVGVSCIALWIFYQLDTRFKKKMTWLTIFGVSPFLIYFIAEVPDTLLEELLGDTLKIWYISLIWGVVVIAYCSVIAWFLYKNDKRVSTIKASLMFLVTVIGLLLIIIILELTIHIGILDIFN